MLLTRIKLFLQSMLPIKPKEEEFLNKAVLRLLVALLQLKPDIGANFTGRAMTGFTFTSMALLKELNGVLAYWLTEEHSMDKHVKVECSHQIIGSAQSKMIESQIQTSMPAIKTMEADNNSSSRQKRLMKYRKTNLTHMLEPDILSPSPVSKKNLSSFKLEESPKNSVFPQLKISKFNNELQKEVNTSNDDPKPVRKFSESMPPHQSYLLFKNKYAELPKADQERILTHLKSIIIRSPQKIMGRGIIHPISTISVFKY